MEGFSCSLQVGKSVWTRLVTCCSRCCPMLPVFPNKSLQVRDTELVITLAQAYQKSFRSLHYIQLSVLLISQRAGTKMTSSKKAFEPGVIQHMIQPRSRADITDTDWMHVSPVIFRLNHQCTPILLLLLWRRLCVMNDTGRRTLWNACRSVCVLWLKHVDPARVAGRGN